MSSDRKWITLFFVTATALIAWVLNQTAILVLRLIRVSNPRILEVFTLWAVLSVLLAGLFVFYYSRQSKVQNYALEVLGELKKVVWPVKKMASLSTVVVLVTVVVMALILGILDWISTSIVGVIL